MDYVAASYSVSPKVLLAVLEYQTGAFSMDAVPEDVDENILGLESPYWPTLYLQLLHAADMLNDGYYRWREGDLVEFELADGSINRPDPWQNAATVALQYYFAQVLDVNAYQAAIGPDGFAATYQRLFGDPWGVEAHIPGSLTQPQLSLPYVNDVSWAFTGGPHSGWGSLMPGARWISPRLLTGLAASFPMCLQPQSALVLLCEMTMATLSWTWMGMAMNIPAGILPICISQTRDVCRWGL